MKGMSIDVIPPTVQSDELRSPKTLLSRAGEVKPCMACPECRTSAPLRSTAKYFKAAFPDASKLAARFEISRRTIHRDIEFGRDRLGMPLEFDFIQNGYFYTDPTFRLPSVQLTKADLCAMLLAERAVQQYKGLPFAAELAPPSEVEPRP